MGMLKRMKDLKDMTEAAPGMVQQARVLGAQAQEYAAAQQAAMQVQQAAAPAPAGADFDPIAGVSLELFAEVSKGLAAYNYDITKATELAASKGVAPDDWNQAMTAWNDRIKANPAVAKQFNALYTGRA